MFQEFKKTSFRDTLYVHTHRHITDTKNIIAVYIRASMIIQYNTGNSVLAALTLVCEAKLLTIVHELRHATVAPSEPFQMNYKLLSI